MTNYDLISENPESTIVAEFEPGYHSAAQYQSEAEMEADFISMLERQAYERLNITCEAELIANLRLQIERLNNIKFTDKEWNSFFTQHLGNPNQGIVEKTRTIQEDNRKTIVREDGSTVNITIIDKANIHNNHLQVINQYVPEGGAYDNRYDVTILVNGLPLVHVELKRRGVSIKDAFNQINRYQRDSFWAGCGLYEFVQIFVISNGTITKYYSNTTRDAHIKEQANGKGKGKKQTSNSFEFTSYWARLDNEPIYDLVDFTQTFLAKRTLLNVLTKYCIFTSEDILMVMRPYQIAATEKILQRLTTSSHAQTWGKREGGGYIWHTTGSGKTLTSFKTARLASRLPDVDKVFFVVDRKDLDYQTMKEYDRFEKGAANSNGSTAVLTKQINDPNARIIITTIQKLTNFIARNPSHKVYGQHVVLIFDECHRSQFGDMHTAITRRFKRYFLFGFTGTPIFAKNAVSGGKPNLRTTEQAFGEQLHTYTIVNAINDKNVLPFRIEYVRTIKEKEHIENSMVWDIAREEALTDKRRIANIVSYILQHFNQKTKRSARSYEFHAVINIDEVASAGRRNKVEEIKQRTRLTGFNSIFAVSSIETAKMYYAEFKRQMAELPSAQRLKVATIYSFGVNEDADDFIIDENSEDTSGLDRSSRDFLEEAIKDYNAMFTTSYDTSSDKFQNYYKDVSLRMKNRELDLLIVVNMFLTGFDATTLNTLWVDKNLRMHGLLQAYSRTNRILNSIKTFGNIVCFRNLETATNESLALFGDKEAAGIVLLKTFDEYYNGYTQNGKEIRGYAELVDELLAKYPVGEQIVGEQNKKNFVRLYGAILKLRNILATFDAFAGREILTERDVQDYHSAYIDLYNEFRPKKHEAEHINDDVVFEMELIKQVEINIDYILALIRKYHEEHLQDKEIIVSIRKAIDSSVDLRNKKELIERFIESLTPESDVDEDWLVYVEEQRRAELDRIIADENLNHDEAYKFMDNAFRDGFVQTTGTAITKVLPPVSRFTPTGDRTKKREAVIERLTSFFNRFWDIISSTNQN